MNRRNTLKSMTSFVLAAGMAGLVAACSESKPQFKAVDVTGADYAKDFHLVDQNGQLRGLHDFQGKLVVLFFGYTQCPDACPTTMAELAEAKKLLGPDADKIQVLFVTVDPERDTPQFLKGYMANFDPSFLALRGTPEQLASVAKDFKVYYKKVDGDSPTSYTMDHSVGSYVYDTQGRLRLYTRYGTGPQALASDMQLLLKQG
jgi:protein SCO1/2